jgi:hypothetical protein
MPGIEVRTAARILLEIAFAALICLARRRCDMRLRDAAQPRLLPASRTRSRLDYSLTTV